MVSPVKSDAAVGPGCRVEVATAAAVWSEGAGGALAVQWRWGGLAVGLQL